MDILSASIIPADAFIAINGEGYAPCCFDIDPHDRYGAVHAIQWFGTHGHYEHARGPSLPVADVAVIETFLPAWRKARALALRERHTALARELVGTADMIQAIEASLPQHDAAIQEAEKSLTEVADHGAAAGVAASADRMRREKGRLGAVLDQAQARHAVLVGQEQQASLTADAAEREAAA